MRRCGALVRLGVFLLVLALAAPAAAQEFRGRINGVVRDNTGGVLPGVTVTATSPALMQPQVAVTDSDGNYRLIALPAGSYILAFELTGFRTLNREGVRVAINTTLTVSVQLELASLAETVTVSGESPVVDTSTTGVGTNFTKELLTEIPNARDIWAAMSQAPGFQMTGFDVGGSHTGTQTGYVTYGISQQRTTRIEGVNTTEGTDANAGYFDFGAFEEFQLGAAGSGADQDTAGASLNITVKSGGDKFTGQWYSDWMGADLIANNVPSELAAGGGKKDGYGAPPLGVSRGNQTDKQYDLNGNLGGPIYRGKAWFFTSWRLNNQFKYITGMPGVLAQSKLPNITGKGTFHLGRSNQLIGYWNKRTKLQPLRDLSTVVPISAAYYQESVNYTMKGEWTSVINDHMFLDVIVGHWINDFPLRPTEEGGTYDGKTGPGRIELNSGQYVDGGASDFYQKQRRRKPQFTVSFSYYKQGWLGDHDFKFGSDGRWEKRMFYRDQPPGNVFYRDRGTAVSEIDVYNTPNDGDNRTTALAFYVQDTWKVKPRFTVNWGVRYDRYKDFYPDQQIAPEGIAALAGATDPTLVNFLLKKDVVGKTVAKTANISPRAGFAWDIRGNNKSVVKGYFGRFYFNSAPDTLAALQNPVGTAQLRYRFNDLNANRLLDSPQELGALLSTQGGAGFVRIDPNIKRPYSQELSAHFEQEVVADLSARASYVYKNIRNDWAEVDLLRVGTYTIPVAVTDVGPDGVAGTSDDARIQVFDRQAGVASDRVFTNPSDPAYDSDYSTVEFALNRRFKGKWMALTAVGYTWLDQFHAVTSTTSALDSAGLGKAYNWRPNQRVNANEQTTIWSFKLIGRYVLPYDIGLSGSYKLQSGRNWGRTISVALPNAGSETILAEPANARRAPNVGILDLRVDKSFTLGKLGRVTGMVDVFNAANSAPPTNFRITTVRLNEIIALLDPRVIRLGFRWEF